MDALEAYSQLNELGRPANTPLLLLPAAPAVPNDSASVCNVTHTP